jgi:Zn-dependent M28 family amino/carboxypeptidase
MLGSPNYYRGVYDGRSAQPMNSLVYNGSATIQQLFENFWSDKDLPCDSSSFDGRSDYGPFLAKDIPCGGLFTGAEVIKSEAFVARYGGLANTAYDPCYHQWCDTVLNINQDVYEDMAQAAATVLETLAIQSDLTSYFAENVTPGEDHVPCAPVETTAAPKRQLTAAHRVFI